MELVQVSPSSELSSNKKNLLASGEKTGTQTQDPSGGSAPELDPQDSSENDDPSVLTGNSSDSIGNGDVSIVNPASIKFFAVDSTQKLISLDQKIPITFCVQRDGLYSAFCKSLRALNDGVDYSSQGQQGTPRVYDPLQGVHIEVETDPVLGSEYYYSAYQPAGYAMKVFQKSDPTCRVQNFSDIQGLSFSSYADPRDAHVAIDNPKILAKTKECSVVVFQYLTSPELKKQYSGQADITMVHPRDFSEWLSVDGPGNNTCDYSGLGLKDFRVGPASLPICGTHHVWREDGGSKERQLGMMIGLSGPFGGVLTDFDLWWRKSGETQARGTMQIAEVSTPTDSGLQFTASWGKWDETAVRQYDSRLNQCAQNSQSSPIKTNGSVWNQLSGGIDKTKMNQEDEGKITRLTPCARKGLGFNWGFDVALKSVTQGNCAPFRDDRTYSSCSWTESSKTVPFATDMVVTTAGNLHTTPVFFPFGSKPYFLGGKTDLYLFTRSNAGGSVISAVHRVHFKNFLPNGITYRAAGQEGQLGQGSWRAFLKQKLIDSKAYLVLIDKENNKGAWTFDPGAVLKSTSKLPGTQIPILGNLGLSTSAKAGVTSNSQTGANLEMLEKICFTHSPVSCRNGKPKASGQIQSNELLNNATIDRILFLYPFEDDPKTFRVLSLHRQEIESRVVGGVERKGYQPSPFQMVVNDKNIKFLGPFFAGTVQELPGMETHVSGLSGAIQYPSSVFVYDYGLNESLNDLSLMDALSGY